MRRLLLLLVLIGLLVVAIAPASAQNSLCRVDLSEVSALLTRAQAASAGGDPASALALVNRADALLAAIENRCDLPEVTVTAAAGDAYTANGFTLNLPPGWAVDADTAANSGGLLIGTSTEAARAMSAAEPALPPGQAGMLIVHGSPSAITNGALQSGDLEAVTRYFQIALGSAYLLEGDPNYFMLNGRASAQLGFSGAGFEGTVILTETAPGRFAVVAASAPRGELTALAPVAQSVAASITPVQEG
jgi:hypothetical protein